ncbi:MAG: hypothetical protein Q9220_003271 [cf. Caloplaca sp. 1 TL-2023]
MCCKLLASAASSVGQSWLESLKRPRKVMKCTHETSITVDLLLSLKKAKVIPDGNVILMRSILLVLGSDFFPSYILNITYPSSKKKVDLGNKIKPSAVSSAPYVYAYAMDAGDRSNPTLTARSNHTLVLALTDPDATSRADPVKSEMCHWIVVAGSSASIQEPVKFEGIDSVLDVSPENTPKSLVGSSNAYELMTYYPPAPPPKTGYHRYVFVLLTPKSKTEDILAQAGLKKPKERPHWGYGKVGKGVRDWAADNDLTPVGAQFFYSKNKKQ